MEEGTGQRLRVKRCVRCVMPDSVPGADFDEAGVCRWCRNGFPNYVPFGEGAMEAKLADCRGLGGSTDCLVAVSGGKDSLYSLLQLQRRFGMNAEAFTYVHDGLEAFALENARRGAELLGVRHHLVSLPNHVHQETCKGFFRAWVKSRDPVAAAMICVACKHLHLLGLELASRRGIPLVVWSMCPLEVPPFIPTQPERADARSNAPSEGVIQLAKRLLRSLLADQAVRRTFLAHLPTCARGCLSFDPGGRFPRAQYRKVQQVQFFNYIAWDGQTVTRTLAEEINWKVPETVKVEWHSDCLYNVLKEYVFQSMLLASYTDAFLSNQIRHGILTRKEGCRQLLLSKAYFAERITLVLPAMGLADLIGRIDTSCFDVDDKE